MNKISSAIDRFCYNHPNFGIPNLMLLIVGGNVLVYIMDMLSNFTFTNVLTFVPAAILHGQIWRLLSFVFVPTNPGNPLFFAITLYFYYFIGSHLERQWGTARFNVFYLTGVVLSIITGLLLGFAGGGMMETATMYYVNMSLFFAFATMYPDMTVLLFLIIPVKMKWLAWLDAAIFAVDILGSLLAGQFLMAFLPIIALMNYFIFFGADLLGSVRRTQRRVTHQHSAQTINFKKATKEMKNNRGYIHKCCVCGITDTDAPDMEFRYCSKCAGYRCYCMNHINNHAHISE